MPTLKTKLSDESLIHERMRKTLENLWSGRQKGLDWRLVGTTSFGHGRGLSWVWLRKFGDVFAIGNRTGSIEASRYEEPPFRTTHHAYDNTPYMELKREYKWERGVVYPTDMFWNDKPWVICTPEKTYFPAMVDVSRNNQFWGMGLYRYQMYNNGNVMRWNLRQKLGAAFIGRIYNRDPQALITGGLCATKEGMFSYGSVVESPVSQIYDKGIYNRGQQALRAFRNVMEIYVRRHKILEPGWWGMDYEDEFLWAVVNRFDKAGVQGLSPTWILDTHMRVNQERIKNASSWHRDNYCKVPFREYTTMMRSWKEIGLESGFCRIVSRGTPLYNESSPVEPDTTDYDDLILNPD